ncbi:MAG TPA: PAS domain S-box protein [Usitatibacter sp.]|nr:PAS domain S-box protein [Usitatibacter sp.]
MELQRLRDEFLRIIEDSRDIVGLYDVDGKCLYVNHPDAFDGAAAAGDPFSRVDAPDRESVRAAYADVVRSAQGRRLEFRTATHDGRVEMLQTELSPVRDPAGKTVAVLCIARNVTEERRGEAALRSALETLFEQAPVGICISDMDGKVVRVNPRMQTLLGYSGADLLKCHVWDVTHPDDQAVYRELVADLLAGRLERFAFEKRVVRADHEVRWVNCSTTLVRPALGAERFTVEMADARWLSILGR